LIGEHGQNSVELTPEMLVGKELLDKARSLSNRPEDDIARGCGYVGPSGRLLKKSFYRALVEAKAAAQGWQLPKSSSSIPQAAAVVARPNSEPVCMATATC
jgi:hypothetical protein